MNPWPFVTAAYVVTLGGGAIGASGPMLARQKRWTVAFSSPFRKAGVSGSRRGNDLRVARVCGRGLMMVAGFSSDFSVPGSAHHSVSLMA